jgi:serine protease
VPSNTTPAKVMNLSLGVAGAACSQSYRDAVTAATAAGSLVIVSAGNGAGGPVGSPANCPGALAVLGLRHAGTKVGFSDLGPEVGISAPGGNCINIRPGTPCLYPILSATNLGSTVPAGNGWTNSFDISVGTSFASPLVAGTAALMKAVRPALTPDDLRNLLRSTARPFPNSGADNGPDDPSPVATCVAPQSNVEQLQCYCTTSLCGAGMLDAGAAVAAAGAALASISVTPAAPQAGTAISLSGVASSGRDGRPIVAWSWSLVSGGGVASGFSSATNASTASIQPTAGGTLTVRLTVTDDAGNSASCGSGWRRRDTAGQRRWRRWRRWRWGRRLRSGLGRRTGGRAAGIASRPAPGAAWPGAGSASIIRSRPPCPGVCAGSAGPAVSPGDIADPVPTR